MEITKMSVPYQSLLTMAERAEYEQWDESRAGTELKATFPEGADMQTLYASSEQVVDLTLTPTTASWLDRLIMLLAADLEGDRKKGLVHVALAGAWLMRAQFGGEGAAWQRCRFHHRHGVELLSPDDTGYQALRHGRIHVEHAGW